MVSRAAAELPDVTVRPTPGAGIVYESAGIPFAAVSGDGADFHVGSIVAAAARATPGTSGSPRGAEWVRFAPPELDRFARDRATAWFTLAWRTVARDDAPGG